MHPIRHLVGEADGNVGETRFLEAGLVFTLGESPRDAADVVITMGCGDACPIYPGKRYEDWDLEDPAGKDLETVRTIRDEISKRIDVLIGSLPA